MQMERVAIFGLGNVALDCARVLLRGEDAMGRTDIARHAQEARKRSAVKRVDIIGRRGAVQVKPSCPFCVFHHAWRGSLGTVPQLLPQMFISATECCPGRPIGGFCRSSMHVCLGRPCVMGSLAG